MIADDKNLSRDIKSKKTIYDNRFLLLTCQETIHQIILNFNRFLQLNQNNFISTNVFKIQNVDISLIIFFEY